MTVENKLNLHEPITLGTHQPTAAGWFRVLHSIPKSLPQEEEDDGDDEMASTRTEQVTVPFFVYQQTGAT